MKTHIRFNGAGGHYAYLLGIASVLQNEFDLRDVIFSGYSAGCVPALLCCLNINIEQEYLLLNIPLLKDLSNCMLKAFFNFIPYLKKHLLRRLNKHDKSIYKNANYRLYTHLTHIPSLETHILNKYVSNEDLIDSAMASGHIPLYNNSLFYKHRDQYYVDGGLKRDNMYECRNANFIEIKCDRYRQLPGSFLFISTCLQSSKELFDLGRSDAYHDLENFRSILKR